MRLMDVRVRARAKSTCLVCKRTRDHHHIEICMVIVTYLSMYGWCWQVNHLNTHILSMILIFSSPFFLPLLLPQRLVLVLIVVNRRTRLSLSLSPVYQLTRWNVQQHQQYQQSTSMIDNGKKSLSLTFTLLIGQCIIDRHFHFGH